MKGMILAAGIGSRLKPWTDHHPKALAPIGRRPVIEYALLNMKRAGISEVIVNVHHFSNQVVEYLKACPINDIKIIISDETDELLDTGGALTHAADLIGDHPVLVHNADIYTDIDLKSIIDFHAVNNNDVTLLVSKRTSTRQLVLDENRLLKGWINNNTGNHIPDNLILQPDDTKVSFNGIHILSPEALSLIKCTAKEKKFPILPIYVNLAKRLKIQGLLPQNSEYAWFDIGTPDKLTKAIEYYNIHS